MLVYPLHKGFDLRSEQKFIPRPYLDAKREARLDLLRGLLDTDGWVERWGTVRYATSSERLARDVVELVRSLGGWCTTARRQPHFRVGGERRAGLPSYVLTIAHPSPGELMLMSGKQARAARPRDRDEAVERSMALRLRLERAFG